MTYKNIVEKEIRRKYSVSDELAILRQRDVKPEEFAEYNEYCEKCKQIAREKMVPKETTSEESEFKEKLKQKAKEMLDNPSFKEEFLNKLNKSKLI